MTSVAHRPRPEKWRIYLRLGRVSNLPTVWTNTLAGIVLSTDPAGSFPASRAVVLATAMSLLYVGGMFLNDAFDREHDARERPERPIPAGWIESSEVFGVGVGLLATGVALVAADSLAIHAEATVAAIALLAAILLYDAWHKANPLSPLLMGLCRVLVYVTAALATSGRVGPSTWLGSVLLLSYLMGLTFVAKQEALFELRNMWPLALLYAPFLVLLPGPSLTLVGGAFYVAFLAWVVVAVMRLRAGRRVIPSVVVSLIAGISLLDAMLIASHGAPAMAFLASCGFGATLFLQRYVSGT